MARSSKQTGPLQNLFVDIEKILDFIETKDMVAAKEGETEESRKNANLWIAATEETDDWLSYKEWWTKSMFQEVRTNITYEEFNNYMKHPYSVPYYFHDTLLQRSRERFMESYEETNPYYRMIQGLPDIDETEFIYLSEDLAELYDVDPETPVHELTSYIQNLYMNTDEYKEVVEANPDAKYLLYLGDRKIDLYAARKAYDFDIIRYPMSRTDINPVLLKEFARLYKECREYCMVTLYNDKLVSSYVNYRTFMGVLIMSYTLMRVCNTALDGINTGRYMDDTILHIILSMYGIPDTMLMSNSVRRDLVSNIKKLVKKKGTKEVYYDIIKILGYQDVVISKLMLMKNQKFDSEGTALSEFEPYFVQIDLKDDNPYESIITKKAKTYTYHEIIDTDPMWWDLPEVREILTNKRYSEADSKYITIDAMIHQTRYVFESVYFTRMILDNKAETDKFMISIPQLLGTEMVSVFDIILFVICATCMAGGMSGEIVTDEDQLLAISGFNFEAYDERFLEYLDETKYVDVSRLKSFLNNINIISEDDVNRVFNDTIYPLREWLEKKIISATNRQEYIEYENIYRALFTYDILRNRFLDDFEMPIETIIHENGITEAELDAFKHFYPNMDGRAITVQEFNALINVTKYHYPFININDVIDWYVQIIVDDSGVTDDRGCLYFWDVLNCEDVRELTNPNGTRIFMDYEDEEIGWQLNQKAVDKAIELIDRLDDDMLSKAYFQIYTQSDGAYADHYDQKEMLPPIIRSTGIFKTILKEKILLDCKGLCNPPKTYFESLSRKNESLYSILMDNNRYETDRQAWYNDISSIISAMESDLSIHMKYFEQSVIGESMFFKPLITLINHFKSTFVNIAKTSVKYIFDSKMDNGGNSNMLKLFDDMPSSLFHIILNESIEDSNFGLYDAWVKSKMKILLKDTKKLYRMTMGTGFMARRREEEMGSVHMSDEMIIFKNGTRLEDSYKSAELEELNNSMEEVVNADLDGWRSYVS